MSCQVQPSASSSPVMFEKVPLHLRAEVADVNAYPVLINRRGAGDEQDGEAVQVDAHAARKRARFGSRRRLR